MDILTVPSIALRYAPQPSAVTATQTPPSLIAAVTSSEVVVPDQASSSSISVTSSAVQRGPSNLTHSSTHAASTAATGSSTEPTKVVVLTNAVVMTTAIATCLSIAAVLCLVWTIGRYYLNGRQHTTAASDVRPPSSTGDLVADVATGYWVEIEPSVGAALQYANEAERIAVFRSVTEYDMFAYKFRTDNDVYTAVDAAERRTTSPFVTLKRLEHLFESLTAVLPDDDVTRRARGRLFGCRRSRSRHAFAGLTFGRELCILACRFSLVWCDDCRPAVRRALFFFGEDDQLRRFDGATETDRSLATRVLASVPYVQSLQLVGSRFQLPSVDFGDNDDSDLSTEMSVSVNRMLRHRIAAIDRRLSIGPDDVIAGDTYRELRDICTSVGIVHPGPSYPDPELVSPADCAIVVRHMFRTACGVAANVRRLRSVGLLDERFRRFVDGLFDSLTATEELDNTVQQTGGSLVACARALTGHCKTADADAADYTRAVLERVEVRLQRQYERATTRKPADARRGRPEVTGRIPSMPIKVSTSRQRPEVSTEPSILVGLRTSVSATGGFELPSSLAASELSIYATAMSASSTSSAEGVFAGTQVPAVGGLLETAL